MNYEYAVSEDNLWILRGTGPDGQTSGNLFSFLADAGGWQRWFFLGIGVAASLFILHLLRKHYDQPLMATSLSLILGGALGNIFDRVWHGFVVDFLYFHYERFSWPAFNVADSAITIGAILLIWDGLRRQSPASQKIAGQKD